MLLNLNERTDDVRNLIRSGLRYQHRALLLALADIH